MNHFRALSSYVLVFTLFFASCKTAEPVATSTPASGTERKQEEAVRPKPETVAQELKRSDLVSVEDVSLAEYRNSLKEVQAVYQNGIPEEYQQILEYVEVDRGDRGFRIQIASVTKKNDADEAIRKFNEWIFAREDIRYKAHAYVEFKSPYFKVHVGDFQTRNEALEYNKKVKRAFVDAWVVNDKINLDRTPEALKDLE